MDEKRLVDGATALAEKQSRVIKIEPAERPKNVRLRVAAYTRVSSDSEDQLNSFAAQNRYYTELISGKAEWRMVDIYADEGISGTSVAKRDDFQRMMADCRRGLIDQILVKSISRFARNTKDCLQNIRELKELGVNVRFEREGIDSFRVLVVDGLALGKLLIQQAQADLTGTDDRHQLFQVWHLPGVGRLVPQHPHMMGQPAAVDIVRPFAQKIEHLRKGQRHKEIVGAVRIADAEECRRPAISHAVKLQLVIGHDLPKLGDVKGGQTCAAGNKYAFGRLAAA